MTHPRVMATTLIELAMNMNPLKRWSSPMKSQLFVIILVLTMTSIATAVFATESTSVGPTVVQESERSPSDVVPSPEPSGEAEGNACGCDEVPCDEGCGPRCLIKRVHQLKGRLLNMIQSRLCQGC